MDRTSKLRGATTVNDELEVGFDERFEEGWSRLQFVGRIVMSLVLATGLAGYLGGGPLDHARVGHPLAGAVDYQPIARFGTPTQVTLHLPPATGETTTVTLSSTFVEPFGLQSIAPLPVRQSSERGALTLTFDRRPGGLDDLVRLHGKPARIGPIALVADMRDTTLRFSTFVLP
jgi:hypothetical protein